MNEKMERMLEKMVDDFNKYSELVALRYIRREESKYAERLLQRSIGRRECIEEYMKGLADLMGVKLKYGHGFEVYGRGEEWEQEIKYRTVEVVKEGKQYESI